MNMFPGPSTSINDNGWGFFFGSLKVIFYLICIGVALFLLSFINPLFGSPLPALAGLVIAIFVFALVIAITNSLGVAIIFMLIAFGVGVYITAAILTPFFVGVPFFLVLGSPW